MRWFRGLFAAFATVALLAALALSVLRNVDSGSRLLAMATSFASYAVIGYLFALLVALLQLRGAGRGRPWLLVAAGVSAIGLLVSGWWLAPQFRGEDRGTHTDLTLLTANLQYGAGDAATVVREAVRQKADLVVLEEVTFEEYDRLKRSGLIDLLPEVAGRPDYSAAGTMVFSRYPLTDARGLDVSNGGVSVEVAAPQPFRLLAAHPAQPVNNPAGWHRDLRTLQRAAASSVKHGPTILAGDFNATTDHVAFRAILGTGLEDAAVAAGSGWQPTWPESLPRSHGSPHDRGAWLKPLIAIDHVLFSKQYIAVGTATVPVPGSDHRGLVARLDRR